MAALPTAGKSRQHSSRSVAIILLLGAYAGYLLFPIDAALARKYGRGAYDTCLYQACPEAPAAPSSKSNGSNSSSATSDSADSSDEQSAPEDEATSDVRYENVQATPTTKLIQSVSDSFLYHLWLWLVGFVFLALLIVYLIYRRRKRADEEQKL